MKNYLILLVAVFSGVVPAWAQFQRVQFAQTNPGGGNCYSVTPDQANIRGAVWSTTQADLTQPQDWLVQVNLGCKDGNGADGMAFVLQPYGVNSIGNGGGTLGFGGLASSIGVELDTWSNNATSAFDYLDPPHDHMAIQRNGNLNHANLNQLAGPVRMIAGVDNLEDCQWHDLRVTWDPATLTLDVYFDCDLRLSYTGDIVNTTFFGNPLVYWGFTAATGGAFNQQQVCFDPPPPTQLTQTYTLCEGDTLQPTLGPGSDYNWTADPALSQLDIADPEMFPTTTTVFTVNYKDPCGQPVTETITVVVVPAPPVNLPLADTLRLCAGEDSLLALPNLPVIPGLSILWHDGTNNLSFLIDQPGLIWAEVNVGCTQVRDSMVVVYDTIPAVDLGPDLALCEGDVVPLDATNNFALSYTWQDGSTAPTFDVAQPGTYHVTLDGLCGTGTDTLTVTYDSLPRFELGDDPLLCEGELDTLDASVAGATYLWHDNSTDPTFEVSQPGLIWAETSNFCGTWRDSVVAVYDSFPVLDLGPDLALCEGDSVVLTPEERHATDFNWFDNSSVPTYLVTQPGTIWATSSNRCGVANDTLTVTYDSLPRFELGPDQQLCDNDTVQLAAMVNNATFVWQDNSTDSTFLVQRTGQYFATATNRCGTWSDTVFAAYDSTPVVELGPDQTLCAGEPVVLDAAWPGANVLWDDGPTEATRLIDSSGTYRVTVSNRCATVSDEVAIEFFPLPEAELGPADTLLCGTGPLVLDVTQDNATYRWHDGGSQSSLTVNQEGTYSVTVSRAGCSASDTINVRIGIVPVVEIGDEELLCDGEVFRTDVSIPDPAATYRWSDNSTSPQREISQAGNYTVTVENECGSVSDNIFIRTAQTPTVDLGEDETICEGETRLLDATFEQATYQWQDGSTTPTFQVDTGGLYAVVVRTACGRVSDEVFIAEIPRPEVDLGPDTVICAEVPLRLTVPDGQGFIEWQDGSTVPTFEVTEEGLYAVTIENVCGVFRDEILVGARQCECELFVPTAFTPDGNATNDEFYVVQGCSNLQSFQLRIFNRWGREVFVSDDPAQGWNGNLSGGRPAATGVYAWVVEYVYQGGEGMRRDVKQGTVTLMR